MDQARRLFAAGRQQEAFAVLERHLQQFPDDPAAFREIVRLAIVGGDQGRAYAMIDRALGRFPDDPALLAMAAVQQENAGQGDNAMALAHRALALDPFEPVASALLSRLLTDRCQPGEALALADHALQRQPEATHLLAARASALLFQGRAGEASIAARSALAGRPDDAAAIGCALTASLYDESISAADRAELHRRLGARIVPARCNVSMSPAGGTRLRVGFYSADFRQHPVGQLIRPVLEQLDPDRFESVCYAQLEHRDAMTDALKSVSSRWREVTAMSDEAVLEQMRGDRLDVLVDLAGHSHGGRPRVLRGRAAPVQLAWLGYLNSSGLPEVDGLIGDDVVLPPGSEALYVERLWRLPLGIFCLQSPEHLPPLAPLPMIGRGAPTLGSFNHLAKLSDATVALWSALLHARADARLVLCAISLLEERTRAFTAARFAAHSIDPARIELRPPQPPGEDFLRQYDDIDIALDPLPFSGGATTLDALRQGVPVVTLPGEGMHTRSSASVLQRIGLDVFIASDQATYLDIALDWLQRPDALAAIRTGLRARLAASPASDSDRYTRGIERLLLEAAGR